MDDIKVGRIVCAGNVPRFNSQLAREALIRGTKGMTGCSIISAPGGFVFARLEGRRPGISAAVWGGSRGWNSRPDFAKAAEEIKLFYWDDLTSTKLMRNLLDNGTKLLTLGIDLYDDNGKVAETVLMHDLSNGGMLSDSLHVTGKTFPRTDEEHELVHAPVPSHTITIEGMRVLALGCHDLNVWSRRSEANTSSRTRSDVRRKMRNWADGYGPNVIIHHAHATDSEKTWAAGWGGLFKTMPLAKHGAWYTTLGYYNEYGRKVEGFRSPLDKVRSAYCSENVQDKVLVF